MQKEFLVAGGTGLVGRNLTARLGELGLPFASTMHTGSAPVGNYNFLACDFCNFDDCLSATKNKSAVILCAAVSYGAKRNRQAPTANIMPNLKITAGLLEACARNNVETVLMLSSSTIYQPVCSPVKESDLDLNQSPYSAYFGVGWTYRYLEQLAALYSKTYGIKIGILRPTNIYGPFDKFDEDRAHVVPALIRRALQKENPFEVWGQPDVVRDFIFVDDLIDDIVSVLKGKVDLGGLAVNISSGQPMRIDEAVSSLMRICGCDSEIYFNQNKPSGVPYQAVDGSRYRKLFANNKRTPFDVGVEKTVEWYKGII